MLSVKKLMRALMRNPIVSIELSFLLSSAAMKWINVIRKKKEEIENAAGYNILVIIFPPLAASRFSEFPESQVEKYPLFRSSPS